MNFITQALAFMAAWIVGAVVFDNWLGWTGGWLMWGGVITSIFAGWVSGMVSFK